MDRQTPESSPDQHTSIKISRYPDFSCPFDLETDASLQRLGAVLSQRDVHGQSKVTAYASQSLHPNERKMKEL